MTSEAFLQTASGLQEVLRLLGLLLQLQNIYWAFFKINSTVDVRVFSL